MTGGEDRNGGLEERLSRFLLMSHGVILSERVVDVAGGLLRAYVDSEHLVTDLSQRELLEEDAFHDAMEAALETGERAVREALTASPPPGDVDRWLGGLWPNRRLAAAVEFDYTHVDEKARSRSRRRSLAHIVDLVVEARIKVLVDLDRVLDVIAPEQFPYLHTCEGADDMPGHVKSSLLGCSLTVPIHNGRPRLGTWQGICLCEHRQRAGGRRIVVTVHGEGEAGSG